MACYTSSTLLFSIMLAASLIYVTLLPSSARVVVDSRTEKSKSLMERLKLDGGSPSCWDALFELQSCTGEVVLFFMNGETTHLGANCCDAIITIERQCWVSLLGSLGITAQESDVLRGYCDAAAAAAPPPEFHCNHLHY